MRRMMPNAGSLSEFGGLNGDCGPDATLMLLHLTDPSRWPLTFAALAQLNRDEAAHGDEAANGAQNIQAMSAYLDMLGVPHTMVDYSHFDLNQFHADLKQYAGLRGIAWETSTAGAGLPEDERGVQFHFAGAVGIDDTAPMPDGHTGGYYRVDGDSNTDSASGLPTAPIPTSWQEIAASGPIAYIIVDGPIPPLHLGGSTVNIPAGWTDDGATLTAPNGHRVVLGFRNYVLNYPGGWNASNVPLEEERHLSSVEWHNPMLGGGDRQIFLRTILRYNSAAEGVKESDAGAELLALEAVNVQLATLKADPAVKAKAAAVDALLACYGVH